MERAGVLEHAVPDSSHSSRRATLTSWAWRLAPALAGLGALALTLPTLGRQSLTYAEARTAGIAESAWSGLGSLLRGAETPHAVHDLVAWGWTHVADGSEWSLRLPSALAGAIAVSLTCLLGARLLGHVAGVIAAAALATGLAWITWSQTAQGTTLAVALAVGATLAFVAAVERPTIPRWALWAIVSVACVAVDLLAATVVVAHVAAYATVRRGAGERSARIAAVAAALGMVLVAAIVVSEAGLLSHPSGAPTADLIDAPWELAGRNPVVLVLAAAGVLALALGRVPGEEPWKAVLVGTWVAAPLLGGLAVAGARPALDARHLAVAAPAIAILVAASIVDQPRGIAVALIALLGVTAGVRYADRVDGPSVEGWREAAAAIRRERSAADTIVVRPARQGIALDHYAGEGVAGVAVRGPRVWVVLAEDDAERRLQLARATVRPPRYALRAERRFGERLWLQVWERP